MKKQIEKLEHQLKELKEAYNVQEQKIYESKEHKYFEKNDIVKKDKKTGVVEWTENKSCNCPYERGYMGVRLLSGGGGFIAPTRRDDWEKVVGPEYHYYVKLHNIKLQLTGLEIENIKHTYGGRNINSSKAKIKLLDALDSVQYTQG